MYSHFNTKQRITKISREFWAPLILSPATPSAEKKVTLGVTCMSPISRKTCWEFLGATSGGCINASPSQRSIVNLFCARHCSSPCRTHRQQRDSFLVSGSTQWGKKTRGSSFHGSVITTVPMCVEDGVFLTMHLTLRLYRGQLMVLMTIHTATRDSVPMQD